LQSNGRFLALADLDSHTADQDADAAKAAVEQALPHVIRRGAWKRSTHHKGWHWLVESTKRLPDGKLFDADGNHIGELLSRETSAC
jgi:hypothetical protein